MCGKWAEGLEGVVSGYEQKGVCEKGGASHEETIR